MAKRYKVAELSAHARRPSTRSQKVRSAKGKVTVLILILVIAIVGIYSLIRYVRTDHTDGGVEIVVGTQLMAYIDAQELQDVMTVTEALDAVAVRPASMQMAVLSGPGLNVAMPASDLDALYLISGENKITLTDNSGADLGTLQRIYLPIDE